MDERFGCMYRVTPVPEPATGAATEAPAGWDQREADGNLPGVDKGFDYQPGASVAEELRKFVDDKVKALPETLGKALAEAAKKILEAPETLVFVESKTAKAAADWAVNNNLADYADYRGIKPEVANAWNKGLFDHLQEFPELRANQEFVGTCQAQFERWTRIARTKYADKLVARGYTKKDAELWAVEKVIPPEMGDQYAHSWNEPGAQGVAVNKKYGKSPSAFIADLERDVLSGHSPVGCGTIRSVVDHELGHQLDALLELDVDADVIKAFDNAKRAGTTKEVSGYANTNIKEFIAECWTESCNSPSPRPFAKAISDILRARYRSRFAP